MCPERDKLFNYSGLDLLAKRYLIRTRSHEPMESVQEMYLGIVLHLAIPEKHDRLHVHSQSYSYMLDSICSPEERNDILYQWKTDEHLLKRNTFIGNCYNEFQESQDGFTLMKTLKHTSLALPQYHSGIEKRRTRTFHPRQSENL